jgi:hypothetical protein
MLATLNLQATLDAKNADISMNSHSTKSQITGLTNSLDIAKKKLIRNCPSVVKYLFCPVSTKYLFIGP